MLDRSVWRWAALLALLWFAFGCSGRHEVGTSSPDAGTCTGDGERPCELASGTRVCAGVQRCQDGVWTACESSIVEECNGSDDDCDGEVDEATTEGLPSCTLPGSNCPGEFECRGTQGLICVELEPAPESCDLLDNDCDGAIDEDFKDAEGLYTIDTAHCGACERDCAEIHPLALATECQSSSSGPRCLVTDCPEGTTLAPGGLGCITLNTRLCESCQSDAECASVVGDRCLQYPDGRFCGRDCSEESVFGVECPRGFTCTDGQCRLPAGSTCLCDADDSFDKPCDVTETSDRVCAGIEVCESGSFGACLPGSEKCNGVDDDCDGTIDDGFVDPTTGAYSIDRHHCGGCGVDCEALFSNPLLYAVGECVAADGGGLECRPDCAAGRADANGAVADGCECELLDPTADDPDPSGVDANCDGVDGELARAVFVSPTGSDTAAGTREAPVRTVKRGIELAQSLAGRDHVYVAEGVYEESIALSAGIGVFGGYSPDFSRRDALGGTSVLFGRTPTASLPGAVNAFDIRGVRTRLDGFTVRAATATTAKGNSYAVYVRDSDQSLEVQHCRITAGSGAAGASGADGTPGVDAPDAAVRGTDARTTAGSATQCTNEVTQGGTGAQASCATQGTTSSTNTSGGTGGSADCPIADQAEASGTTGEPAATGGPGGRGGYSGVLVDLNSSGGCAVRIPLSPPAPSDATEDGLPGDPGANGTDGSAGGACTGSAGSVVSGEWQTATGGMGGGGLPGKGGGGGGAAGGVEVRPPYDVCTEGNGVYKEVIGAAGGGGGAGGCGGFGGAPGAGGGGAFAIFVVYSSAPSSLPAISDNVIERGFGGAGAAGGAGGKAGQGSAGALGGTAPSSAPSPDSLLVFGEPGGRGGDGGRGGYGGGGAGGCGGPSVGIFFSTTGGLSTAALRASNLFSTTGAAGAGGSGGPSQGNRGPNGASGVYADVGP